MLDARITHTFIGQEYGWDHVSDADPAMLRQNRECHMNVLANLDKFPRANVALLEMNVEAIDQFFFLYGDLLEQFA